MADHKVDKGVIITGIVALTVLETTAMFLGFDGVILATIIGVIALAIGIQLPQLKLK